MRTDVLPTRRNLANKLMALLTLHDPAAAAQYYKKGLWRAASFYDLVAEHARERPEGHAARDCNRRLSWAELERWSRAVAISLEKSGLRFGDRVSMAISNRVEALIIFIACSRNGYVCNPSLHKNYMAAEMRSLLAEISSKAVFYEKDWNADKKDLLATGVGDLALQFTAELEPGSEFSLDFLASSEMDSMPHQASLGGDKVCYLAFTSGTTGKPKGVLHSDNTILANARNLVEEWGHDSNTVIFSLSPISHHIAWVGLAQAVISGAEYVLDGPGELNRLDWITESEATYVMGVPTHAIDLLAEQHQLGSSRIGSVKTFYMAGAPIPKSVAESFLEQGITPQNVYGMTENSSHQFTHPQDETKTIIETCGKGGSAYEVEIFDPENKDKLLSRGEVGEIGGRGAALMLGYFNDQFSTEDSFNQNGWFMSGDLGRLDADDNLEVVGRLKDIIIRGGRNIFPATIEDLAVRSDHIEKAAAIPFPDARLGEKVCLIVLSASKVSPKPGEVLNHLKENGLSIYDMPEYFLVVDDLPLTASGKILKRELLVQVEQGKLCPVPVRFVENDREKQPSVDIEAG